MAQIVEKQALASLPFKGGVFEVRQNFITYLSCVSVFISSPVRFIF